MKPENKNQSSFTSFLEGYKEKNIESNQSGIATRVEETKSIMDSLIAYYNSKQNTQLADTLKRGREILSRQPSADLGITVILFDFGAFIQSNILSITRSLQNQDSVLREQYERLVFNFVELAKMTEDGRLIKSAIEIGGNFVA
jgi:hypothetical protein